MSISILKNVVTIVLPYFMTVVFIGDSIIVWKQPDRIISAGMAMIRKDVRMSLLEHSQGNSLKNIFVFKLITDFDEGKY